MKMKLTEIQETLDIIYSFVDYSMTHAENVPPGSFSLDKISRLLEELGNPQNDYASIHVAGTKGKGSVCAMIASGLQAAGYTVGIYTSPHLSAFNERIAINGEMISDQDLIDCANTVIEKMDPEQPASTFEVTTAIAFLYFSRQHVDFAVVETGLGGRLDATNVVSPLLSVITSISIDHTNFLGNTIEEIAAEKAGIIKPGIPVVCSPQIPAAYRVITTKAAETGSELISIPDTYRYINTEDHPQSQRIMVRERNEQYKMNSFLENASCDYAPVFLDLPLAGLHQMDNAVTAYAALIKIKSLYPKIGLDDIINGFRNTRWPCRFESVHEEPLVIVDGAHNVDSVSKLMLTVNRYYGSCDVTCIFGASEDKPIEEMIHLIAPYVKGFIATRSTHPRAADPALITKFVHESGRHCEQAESIESAFDIMKKAGKEKIFIVTGSLFVASAFKDLIKQWR